jgi:hypothetical protein
MYVGVLGLYNDLLARSVGNLLSCPLTVPDVFYSNVHD